MKRLAVLLVLVAVPTAPAELNVKAALDDPRVGDRKVYLRYEWAGDRLTVADIYLPKGVGGVSEELTWELVFDTAEAYRQAYAVCKHNPVGTKIKVHGREVQTLTGRGFLMDTIQSSW